MKKVYHIIFAVVLMLGACSEDIEIEEERLVFEPYDAKVDGLCYKLSGDTKTAVVTAGDVFSFFLFKNPSPLYRMTL